MIDYRATVLSYVQTAPGRWTIDQLAAATGLSPRAIAPIVIAHIKAGNIEAPPTLADLDTDQGRHDITYRPTTVSWVSPCDRRRQ